MTPERWHRTEEVFHAALHRGANERSRFLDSVCAGDPQLRREVESLLASHERTGSFLNQPFSPDAFRVIADESPTESIGSRLATGDLVLGRFKIVRSLGQGGMGEVYEARDLKLDRSVALKTLGAWIEHDPSALYRFKQEFRTLAEFRHPNLVRLYELFSDGQRWFFTMELVDGVDFLAYVRPGDKLDERRLRQSLIQLAEGLTALHAGGKLHLDVKPSNVLISAEGRVQVIDFGLVTERQGTEPIHTDTFLGTPAYMAPEQGANAALSEASDWYSFGVMVYEAVTGQRPFAGSASDIYFAAYPNAGKGAAAHESAAPSRLCPDVPHDLDILCVDLLRRDPTARPRGGDILQRVGAMRVQFSVDGARDVPFVGRQHELKLLHDAYAECRAGRKVLASVSGSSGAGKTALIRQFLRILQDSDPRLVLLSSRCYETETVPFKAIDGLIDGLSRYLKRLAPVKAAALLPRDIHALVRLFPVLGQVDSIATAPATTSSTERQEVRRRGFAALRELLARIADRSPLVILIDDIQWADRDSFALLTDVLGHLDAPGSFVIICHRDERTDVAQDLETLLSLAASISTVRRLQLTDLSYEESLELAVTLLHDRDLARATLDQIARDGAGSPFFVHQLAQFARTPAASVGDQPSPPPTGAPATFATMLARRVASLPEPASHLLDLLALAGRPLTIEQLSAAAGFNIHDDAALPTLRTEKLVRTRPWQGEIEVEPYHDRIREGVVAAVSPESRPQYHLTLAGALQKYTQDFEAIAHHFNAGGEREQAGVYAERAGDKAAAALAFDRAASLYQMAMQLSFQPDAKQRLRLSLAQALADAGRGPEAAQQCLEAARSSVGITSLQLKQRAAEQLLRSGHLDEGLDVLRQVAIAVGLRLSTSQRWVLVSVAVRRLQLWLRGLRYREQDASLIDPHELLRIDLCWSLVVGWSVVDTLRGAEAQALHLALALRSGEPGRVALALAAEAGYATVRGKRSLRRVPHLLASAFQTAERTNNPRALALATFSAGMQSWAGGDFQRAFELCEQAEDTYRTRCTGVAFEIETTQIFALACLAWMGRLKELAGRLVPLRRAAEQRGDRYGSASLTLLTRSWLVHLADDDPDLAEREIADAMQAWPSRGFHLQHFWALFGRFESTLYRGQTGLAAEIAEKQRGAIRRSLLLVNPAGRFFAAHLHACSLLAAASDVRHLPASRDQLLRAAARDMRTMSRQQMLPSRPMVELMSAGAAAIRGHSDEARAWYASAERGFEAVHMDLYAVVARRRRGELTGGDEGRTLIASADSWMQSQSVRNPSRLTATLAPA